MMLTSLSRGFVSGSISAENNFVSKVSHSNYFSSFGFGHNLVTKRQLTVHVELKGRSLADRLSNPTEALTLGPRILLGTSLEALQTLRPEATTGGSTQLNPFERDLDKLKMLLQDDAIPPNEKVDKFIEKLEDRMLTAADKGAELEGALTELVDAGMKDLGFDLTDIRRQLQEVLPFPLPSPPPPPSTSGSAPAPKSKVPQSNTLGSLAERIEASREMNSVDMVAGEGDEDGVVLTLEQMAELRTAAELGRIRDTVATLRTELEEYTALKNEGDVGKLKLARWNLVERRNQLERILRESSTATSSDLKETMEHAQALVNEVGSLP